MNNVTLGHAEDRYGNVVETNGAVASLAKEVSVGIVVIIAIMTHAQLILHLPLAVLDGMYQMMLPEDGKSA